MPMGAWSNKMAWTPMGVWQIEDVHGGVRGRTWMPMGWPGHLRGVADRGCAWECEGEDLGAHGGMV